MIRTIPYTGSARIGGLKHPVKLTALLYLKDALRQERYESCADIIAVGPGRFDDNGKRLAIDVKVGDRVLYAKYSGQEVPRGVFGNDDDEYMILKENDVLAKLA